MDPTNLMILLNFVLNTSTVKQLPERYHYWTMVFILMLLSWIV